MRSRSRRILANFHYLRKPTVEFLPVLLGMVLVVCVGGWCFQRYYPDQVGSYAKGLYITYSLIFMEHLLEFPEHRLLQAFYILLPPLGMAVILDAIVRFSYHILRRDESSRDWVKAMSKTMRDHVVLFGLGKLGLRVLQELLRLKELVVVVERDPQSPNLAYARRHGIPVRIGSGREEGILEELNIARAKSLIMATDDDLANLEVAIDARHVRPDIRVVLRMFDQELAAKIKDAFDIHLAFSTSELAAPLFATASSDRSIVSSFYVGEQLMLVATLEVSDRSALAGKNVAEIRGQYHTLILEIQRDGSRSFFPDADEVTGVGDRLTIQTGPQRLKAIQVANRGER